MKRGGRRVDVGVVLGAGLLEPVQRRCAVVLGEAGVRLALLGQLHVGVLRGHHADLLVPQLHLVQVVHGEHGLLRLRHLHQRRVLLVEQDLDPLHVAVHAEQDEEVIALGDKGNMLSQWSRPAGDAPRTSEQCSNLRLRLIHVRNE